MTIARHYRGPSNNQDQSYVIIYLVQRYRFGCIGRCFCILYLTSDILRIDIFTSLPSGHDIVKLNRSIDLDDRQDSSSTIQPLSCSFPSIPTKLLSPNSSPSSYVRQHQLYQLHGRLLDHIASQSRYIKQNKYDLTMIERKWQHPYSTGQIPRTSDSLRSLRYDSPCSLREAIDFPRQSPTTDSVR